MGPFEIIHGGTDLPIVTVRIAANTDPGFTVYELSERLRIHDWLVPAYPMPPGAEDVRVLRMVIRNGFSMELAGILLGDFPTEVERLTSGAAAQLNPGFHH
jgi:glutamate decarboxylase